MPLNRPARRLMPGPQAVAEARRWIVQTLRDIERDDLLETAELAVSELVTNAVLHSLEPISVRVRGTRQHPRVEVHDGSPEPPILPHETSPAAPTEPSVDVVEADLLATFGRGLDIVARCSEAWGADVDLDSRGKVVWFSPAPEVADHEGPRGVVTGVDAGTVTDPEAATRPVHLRGLPADLFRALGVQQGALRREVRLLSLAHGDTYPAIHELDQVLAVLDQTLRPLLTDPERVVVDQHAGLLDLQSTSASTPWTTCVGWSRFSTSPTISAASSGC
ncbi:ATP-binding protein [Nocardioides bruguierae]|uniref:ATP-binding protein n=1 Tax=Nocardioides bruguierae TaxID=2945102 RepID=A0A9X2D991_9ACTN|nr:ATP-binding protein [Nocardioides bruguierae]MCM0621686.1 ATP-binding protein [Nocardioides bruguierae]